MDHEAITATVTTPSNLDKSKIFSRTNGMASGVFITVETANIRFTLHGTAVTTTTGHMLAAGQNLTLNNINDLENLSMIRDDDVDATVRVSYRY